MINELMITIGKYAQFEDTAKKHGIRNAMKADHLLSVMSIWNEFVIWDADYYEQSTEDLVQPICIKEIK